MNTIESSEVLSASETSEQKTELGNESDLGKNVSPEVASKFKDRRKTRRSKRRKS